ncbi:MAG: glutamate synthase subunit beta [Spirochaeta sp.]|jgi:glutamate synthase (NADPH/NADH) small chain|nr:glutamate synthase subunit beta [Spirochaeta sp.]
MGKPTGFMDFPRQKTAWIEPAERVQNFDEFRRELNDEERERQGARCMDCGIPFCQSDFGCPVDNLIPEWNDLIYHGRWDEAFTRLMKTNNFPEYTGRVCPAPCEHACVLGINEPPVTIKDNEAAIIDRAYENGLMEPRIPAVRTGKVISVIGSGPAGLAAADQLNQAGHSVTVYERQDRIGGLLMYGIPNMKLDKELVERRNALMAAEGITFQTGVDVGRDLSAFDLMYRSDAVVLAVGATRPRDLPVPGRDLEGVHFAMEFLKANTRSYLDSRHADRRYINAEGKNVIVIGGGDTGNDCIGTSVRHQCRSVTNFELMPKPPAQRTDEMPWPTFARTYKSDYGHEEAAALSGKDPRQFSIVTKEFVGDDDGHLVAVRTVRVKWIKEAGAPPRFEEIPGSGEEWPADLVLLAMGFLGPEDYIAEELNIERDVRSNYRAEYEQFNTNVPGVFSTGDARRGQSLVVWAIKEGRGCAREVDRYLMGSTTLE